MVNISKKNNDVTTSDSGSVDSQSTVSVNSEKQEKEGVVKKFPIIFNLVENKELSSVDKEDAINYIRKGKRIAQVLLSENQSEIQSLHPTKENCRDLTWFLCALSFENVGEEFPRGTVRICGQGSEEIYKFLKSCPESHLRPSSHYKEASLEPQRGLDYNDGQFHYRELKTVLFGLLKSPLADGENPEDEFVFNEDGEIEQVAAEERAFRGNDVKEMFIKLETAAISKDKPVESGKHLFNWFIHSLTGGKQNVHGQATYRETDIQDLKHSFSALQKLAKKLGIKSDEVKGHEKTVFKINSKLERLKSDISILDGKKINREISQKVLDTAIESCESQIQKIKEEFGENLESRYGREAILSVQYIRDNLGGTSLEKDGKR